MQGQANSSLTITFSLLALLLATCIGIVEHDVPIILVATSVCLLAGTVGLVRSGASRRLGTSQTLCVLFFMLAVAHIFFGFLLAGLSTQHTSIRSNAQNFFAQAMLINSIGILAGAVGYLWKLNGRTVSLIPGLPLLIDKNTADKLFRLLVILGSALMFFAYWKLGFLDYLSEPSKWPFMRYITGDILGGSAADEWIVNRAMDLLTVSLPFILIRMVKRPKPLGILLAAVGYAALLLPLRRANLLAVTMTFLILLGIERQDAYRFTRKVIVSVALLYVLSQCIFLLGVFADNIDPRGILTVSSTALPEVRDLGWTLSLLNGETLHGVTFAQALIPLPSIASDWSSAHSLRAISTKLIGLDQTGETGGLRLTILGEGYINFGYFGAIGAGFLWGLAVGWCEKLLQATRKNTSLFEKYVVVLSFVWVCFLIYLAGTQAAASVKVGGLLVLGIAWVSKHRSGISQTVAVPLT
jgi:hypothetical protein